MKLKLIHTLSPLNERFKKHAKRVRSLLATIPGRKQRHSRRVGRQLHRIGAGRHSTYAGLLHDYLERGGDLETLQQHIDKLGLPSQVIWIITALSDDEKLTPDPSIENIPLEHIKSALQRMPSQDIKDIVILVKMADRLDNLKKRMRRDGKIGKRYRRKSTELVNYLTSQYAGDSRLINKLQRKIGQLI